MRIVRYEGYFIGIQIGKRRYLLVDALTARAINKSKAR